MEAREVESPAAIGPRGKNSPSLELSLRICLIQHVTVLDPGVPVPCAIADTASCAVVEAVERAGERPIDVVFGWHVAGQ
jgi:uncharacterized membrane protein YjjP (DUF1212 family)